MATLGSAHLEIRRNRAGEPRAYICGTRLRVQDIAAEHEFEGLTPEQIVREFPQLSLGQVHAALSYYFDYREQILAEMKADETIGHALRARLKRPETSSPGDPDADQDSLSS